MSKNKLVNLDAMIQRADFAVIDNNQMAQNKKLKELYIKKFLYFCSSFVLIRDWSSVRNIHMFFEINSKNLKNDQWTRILC